MRRKVNLKQILGHSVPVWSYSHGNLHCYKWHRVRSHRYTVTKTSMAHLPKDLWLRAMHTMHVDPILCHVMMRSRGTLESSGGCTVCLPLYFLQRDPSRLDHTSSDIWGVRDLGRLQQCTLSWKSSNKWLIWRDNLHVRVISVDSKWCYASTVAVYH